MLHPTNRIRKATVAVAFAVSLAALTASQALAGGGSSTYRDGWYGYAVSITKQQQAHELDGRSPVQRIIEQEKARAAAALASGGSKYGPPDGWYGYAVALTKANQPPTVIDGRSPDTLDAARQAHAPVVTIFRSSGFAWDDFGIGIAAACGAMLLLGLATRMLTARQSGERPSSVATA